MNFRPTPDRSESAPIVVSRVRSALVHGGLALFAIAILYKAAKLQLVDGEAWAAIALEQQVTRGAVEPPRGTVTDATGKVLVETRELIQLSIDPRNVRKSEKHGDVPAKLRKHLSQLGVPAATIRRALDTTRKHVPIRGEFLPSEIEPIVGLPGVWRTRVLKRQISAPPGIRRVLGAVDHAGVPRGGIEEELDRWLRGSAGTRALVRDPRGIPVETPLLTGTEATPGHTVVLTFNKDLQEIAESELADAMKRTGAMGGDVVIVDVKDGAILAMAGARNGRPSPASTPLTEAYEPGSIIKPMLIGYLLDNGLAREDEMIDTENGRMMEPGRRSPLLDTHKEPEMSVRDIVRFSSNIGAVKLTHRLSHGEEYQVLRDFGFGVPTGVPYPAESRGWLEPPDTWSVITPSQLAIGYEISTTPLQMAMAYAAIANGGELLQPALVREIRDAEQRTVYRHERRPIRRVLSDAGAERMRVILASVVDSGTGTAAGLETFDVAGKSGTARRVVDGKYRDQHYNSSFAGMFPAQQPQFVFVARLIDPKGDYYGGLVAGPMVNAILQAAIATRDGSLDRDALAQVARPVSFEPDSATATAAGAPDGGRRTTLDVTATTTSDAVVAPVATPVEPVVAPGRVVVSLTSPDSGARGSKRAKHARPSELRAVPLVAGLNVREALHTLHAAGFNVRVVRGSSGRTSPAAGSMARVGSTVALELLK